MTTSTDTQSFADRLTSRRGAWITLGQLGLIVGVGVIVDTLVVRSDRAVDLHPHGRQDLVAKQGAQRQRTLTRTPPTTHQCPRGGTSTSGALPTHRALT